MKEVDLSCTTGWTEWFNQDILDHSQVENMKTSKSNYFKEGDFEPLPNNLQMKNLGGAGKTFCTSDNIAAIECRSVVTHQHPKNTGQNVECSTLKGLVCQGQCFDYEIRVYCDCVENITTTTARTSSTKQQQANFTSPKPPTTPSFTISTLSIPIVPSIPSGLYFDCDEFALRKHPLDCHQYLQCFQHRNGSKILVEKSCGPAMMFNPRTLTCEWPVTVQIIRPECARAAAAGKHQQQPSTTTDPSRPEESRNCPKGFVWSDCAIPCGRSCNYYKRQLLYAGNCSTSSPDCIPGCLPQGSILKCESPMLWRDWKSCVNAEDCTCFGPNNEILKPGSVVQTSDCLTCQCIRNEYICAKSTCTNNVSSTTLRPKTSYLRETCDPNIPHVEHPNSCYKFLHCSPTSNGSYFYAVKTCYPDMMFNPKSMVCDWPNEVRRVKPQCLKNPGEIEIEEAETISIITTEVGSGSSGSAFLINPKCNPVIPLVEHPESCHKYLACERNSDGSFSFVEKVCSTNLMFNPKIQVCDWKSNVLTVKPACGLETLSLVTASPALTTTKTSSLLKIVSSTTTTVPHSFGGEAAVLYVPYLTFCDPIVPHIEHPNSCYKFLHCQPASNGSYMYAVKTCYPHMMFNPETMICDWPSSVMKVKTKCNSDPGEIDLWEMETKFVTRITQPPQLITTTNRMKPIPKTEQIPTNLNAKIPILVQQCDSSKSRAFKEHSSDCHLYLECMKIENGSYFYIEKGCGAAMMFNVYKNECESVEIVSVLRPECDEDWLNLISTEAYENLKMTTTAIPRIISSTLTPPKACNPDKMIPLIESLPDSAFSSSSVLGEAFKPQFAKFSSRPIDKNGGSWAPKISNLNQYLEIAFTHATPIYGFKIKGNRLLDQYVTSFKVLYTVDDITYHVYEGSNKQVKIFSGSADAKTPVMTVLKEPFEAKRIRFYPISWKNAIAMQVEVMGCESKITSQIFTTPSVLIHSTSTVAPLQLTTIMIIPTSSTARSITEFPIQPICDDPLGVENNKIHSNQITFSSIRDSGSVKSKIRRNPLEIIKLSSQRGWIPLSDNTNEFIMVR